MSRPESPVPTALVTGANRGLGLATTRALAQRGWHVWLCARDLEAAQAAAKSLQNEGLHVTPAELDVTSDASVDALFGQLDHLDVLINNAGIASDKPVKGGATLEIPAALALEAFNTNAAGPWRTMRHALPRMNARGFGRIVNLSSAMGSITQMDTHWPAYRVSKAALNAATRIFSAEARGNVKINAVCPGWVQTDMGGPRAPRSVAQGVASILWAVDLGEDGPNGGFFRDGEPLPW